MRRALALVLVLASVPASAFVRTRSSKGEGIPSYWPTSCVFLTPDAAGSPDLPNEKTFAIIEKSAQNWLAGTRDCSYLQLTVEAPRDVETHYDNDHVIKFRTDTWCHPDDKQHMGVCYAPQAAAITSVFMINDGGDQDGLILDADIEMNSIHFTFVEVPVGGTAPKPREGTDLADLENTLTHELGHLLGFSHTCRDPASFPNDVDDSGASPPDCDALASLPLVERGKIMNATMYNFAMPGETKKRTLSDDDVAAVCAAYPLSAQDGKACERTDTTKWTHRSGCAVAGTPPAALAPLVLLFAGALFLRRRA